MKACGYCKAFLPDSKGSTEGVCRVHNKRTFSYNNYGDLCPLFKKKSVKVKPRRMCPFCEQRKPLYDNYGEYTLAFTKLIHLPPINLTSGEVDKTSRDPEYSLFLYDGEDWETVECASFPIKFCPVCGRELGGKE